MDFHFSVVLLAIPSLFGIPPYNSPILLFWTSTLYAPHYISTFTTINVNTIIPRDATTRPERRKSERSCRASAHMGEHPLLVRIPPPPLERAPHQPDSFRFHSSHPPVSALHTLIPCTQLLDNLLNKPHTTHYTTYDQIHYLYPTLSWYFVPLFLTRYVNYILGICNSSWAWGCLVVQRSTSNLHILWVKT